MALRHASFRDYADYMASDVFGEALTVLAADATRQVIAVMCAQTLWWRCHRRLIADAAMLLCEAAVWHLGHDGRLTAHRLTDGVLPRHVSSQASPPAGGVPAGPFEAS